MKKTLFCCLLGIILAYCFIGCDNGSTNTDNTFNVSINVADGSHGMGSAIISKGSTTGNIQGSSVTVTAKPDTNYNFVKWSNNIVGMDSVSTDASYTFSINANTSLFAVFAPVDETSGIFNMTGTWIVALQRVDFTVDCDTKTWQVTAGWGAYKDNGTYTLMGNYGKIISNNLGNIGMFALTSNTKCTMYLVAPNPVTGIFYGTKE